MKVELCVGRRSQFDVMVDGEVVAQKTRPPLLGYLGFKRFPGAGETIRAIERRMASLR